MTNALLLFLFSVGASFVQSVTGFGFGIFAMTMFPYLLPSFSEATMLSGLLALTTSSVIVFKYRAFIEWKSIVWILFTFLVISAYSIFILSGLEEHFIKRILGFVLVLASIYFSFFKERIKLKTNLKTQIGMGVLSGFMGGFFGMQGPPAVLYFMASARNKNVYIACIQVYFLIGNIFMSCVRAYNGFFSREVALNYALGLFGILLGAYIGGKVFRKISEKWLKRAIYCYLAVSGIVVFITA